MIKLNKVTFKQAEAAVRNIHRKTTALESLFDRRLLSLKNSIFTEKHLCWSLVLIKSESRFNKVADLKVWNCIKKRIQHRCFPTNIAKFLRPAFYIEHLRSLILNTHSFCMILPQFAL